MTIGINYVPKSSDGVDVAHLTQSAIFSNNSGRVGMGTDLPGEKLHIVDTSKPRPKSQYPTFLAQHQKNSSILL
jgi:hypothetical protein